MEGGEEGEGVGGAGAEAAAGGGGGEEGADVEAGEDGGDDGSGERGVHRRRGGGLDRIWRGRRRHGGGGGGGGIGGEMVGGPMGERDGGFLGARTEPLLLRGSFVSDHGAHARPLSAVPVRHVCRATASRAEAQVDRSVAL